MYRLYGDAAEAGRWMYLEEDRNIDEAVAFEARYGSPVWRMKALAWRGPEAMAATAFAQGQLVAVRTACAEELGHSGQVPATDVDCSPVPSRGRLCMWPVTLSGSGFLQRRQRFLKAGWAAWAKPVLPESELSSLPSLSVPNGGRDA